MATVSMDQLTFIGSSLFLNSTNDTTMNEAILESLVLGFSGSTYKAVADNPNEKYMLFSSQLYYVSGYSNNVTYITRLQFNTKTPISSFDLTLKVGYNTHSNCKAFISTNANLGYNARDDFAKLSDISTSFGFNSSNAETTISFNNLTIPAGNFYIYLGPNANSTYYNTIYARPSPNAVFTYSATQSTSYTITYNGNGAIGGSTASQIKQYGQDIVLRENGFTAPAGTISSCVVTLKNNGSTEQKTVKNIIPKKFDKWNTAKNGTGTSYNAGATYSINADAIMYAQWKNGAVEPVGIVLGAANREPVSEDQIILTASLYDEVALSYPLTKLTNYIFQSWNTKSDGTGTSYSATESSKFTTDTTLYAIYSPITSNPIVTLPSDIARDGYMFKGWSTNANGSPLISGNTYMPTETQTIYAVWEKGATEAEGMYIYTGNKWHKVASFVK